MQQSLSRRSFLTNTTAAVWAASWLPLSLPAGEAAGQADFDFPLVDFHVHLDKSTIDKVLELSRERGVKFGIVEHAGNRENQYPVVLSNDDELTSYLDRLEGKPVFKGVQAEWNDWRRCFSPRSWRGWIMC